MYFRNWWGAILAAPGLALSLFPTESEATDPGETLVSFTTAGRTSSRGAALALLALLVFFAAEARAVTINWTPVGDPGNANDLSHANDLGHLGAVGYAYNIGTTEVTNSQYVEFLNSVAKTDTYVLWNNAMRDLATGGINRSGRPDSFTYSVKSGYANLPVNFVSWGDAARFANWLANGQPTGLENASTTEDGSYFLNGAITVAALNAVTRKSTATIVIPTENEWYKAAYYNPATSSYFQYPTGSNATPSNNYVDAGNNANFYDFNNDIYTTSSPFLTDVGHFATSASPYGTFDQGGNVWEWNEALIFNNLLRGTRGGSFRYDSDFLHSTTLFPSSPTYETDNAGFRVAMVPEPGSGILAVVACGMMWWSRKRFK